MDFILKFRRNEEFLQVVLGWKYEDVVISFTIKVDSLLKNDQTFE